MKKVLFFTYDFPYPTNTGGKNRAYNLMKFSNKEIDIHLFSFIRDDFDEKNIKKLNEIGVSDIKVFKRKKVKNPRVISSIANPFSSIFQKLYFDQKIKEELIKKIIDEKIDIVNFESFYTGFYICNEIKAVGAKQVFGTENLEYLIYRNYAKYLSNKALKPIYYMESKKIESEEKNMIKNADACLAVTKKEKEYIKKFNNQCFVVENGINPEELTYKFKKRKDKVNILFVGNFSYFPNLSGIKYFYNEIFKKIDNKDITLTIVGKNSQKLNFINDERVRIIDFVEDINKIYREADVFISPVRIGGGTNFKVLEAMALGVPVVAFQERVVDLNAEDGIHLLAAINASEFREKIIRLIEDEELSMKISKNARSLVEENFAWKIIGEKLNKVWHNL